MKKTMKQLGEYADELFGCGVCAADVYKYILMEFYEVPYVWGGQTPEGSDCSGSVCTALSLATGRPVRVTADELYRGFFTEDVSDFSDKNFLYAAFFLDENGRAIHVAGWCEGKYMNVSKCEPDKAGNFRTGAELMRLYPHLKMKKRGMRL